MSATARPRVPERVLTMGEGPPPALPAGCVHELISAQARRTPDNTAVIAGPAQLTYGELDRWTNQVAHRLIAAGVEPGTLVGLCLERSLELVVALVAIWKAGGAYVPLDAEYPRERLAMMASDADLRVLVTEPASGARLPRGYWKVVGTAPGVEPTDDPGPRASPRGLAYVIYTSGSTGRPKGVMVEHRSVANHGCWMAMHFGLTASDAVLQKTSTSFDASVCEFSAPLISGGRMVLAPPGSEADQQAIVGLCRRHDITLIQFVPAMLSLFAETEGLEQLRSLRHLVAGGEALPPALAEHVRRRLPGCTVHNLYGPSEATIDTTAHRCAAGDDTAIVPIGRPIAGARVRVLDEALNPVAVGVPGELWVGGIGLARGYLHRPELTVERFIGDPFTADPEARLYRTGDLVTWREDGELAFLGRSDEQVKVRGVRIELGEIEAALQEQPDVASAAVVLRHDEREPELVAYVVARAGRAPSSAQLRRRLTERLPGHMVPAAYVHLAALPLTANGKLDRRALPAPGHRDTAGTVEYVAPRDGLERELAELWEELLGVTPVGVADDFFALGGSSLLAMRLVTRLRGTHARTFTVRLLFEQPTVAGQARRLRAIGASA